LIITGRRTDRLKKLENDLKQKHKVEILALNFDVRDYEAVKNHLENLPDKWKNIDVLLNNAGLAAGASTIDKGAIDDWNQMIDTNVKGLLYVSKMIMPLMINRKQGHIINIGSIAGKEVYLNGNVYCATKHAVDALSKAMRIDLLPHNIKVTNIAPGMAETEFSVVRYHGDQDRADKVYRDMKPLLAEDIAEVILFAAQRPPHVTLNDIVIMPTAQANTSHLVREKL
ncbi:MAG: SDR family NAD(P)-dependent oxidoreductase, partial [Bacteroidota bacterium]